jgi:predicted RNA binding protein YcfA (HicA-like mRNA interferase family)
MPFKSKDVLRRLQLAGFEIRRQSGSHVVPRDAQGRQTYVPMHTKELPSGLLLLPQRHQTPCDFSCSAVSILL